MGLINRIVVSTIKNFRVETYQFEGYRIVVTDKDMAKALKKVPWKTCEFRTLDGKRVNPPPKPKPSTTTSKPK